MDNTGLNVERGKQGFQRKDRGRQAPSQNFLAPTISGEVSNADRGDRSAERSFAEYQKCRERTLTFAEKGMLFVEARYWPSREEKVAYIEKNLHMSMSEYSARLNDLIESDAAMAVAPDVVARLHKDRNRNAAFA